MFLLLKKIILLVVLICFISCKKEANEANINTVPEFDSTLVELKYAKGFSIRDYGSHKILNIINPWPKSDKTFSFILSDNENIHTLKDNNLVALLTPIKSIVVTSTTHIPALELLGVEQSLIGFPGSDYISSEKTRQRIDSGFVRELGENGDINTEVLLEINPDVVIGYGVDGTNKTFETIQKSSIPVIYNGDWVESSALAKAEWIKFFGVLYNKEKEADSIFHIIETNYKKAKKLVQNISKRPTVLAGAMHKDIWYLPNGSSPEAQFLKDANVNYLWSKTTDKGSLALSIETVLERAQNADIWLSPSYYASRDAMEKASAHYTKFDAFNNKSIYSFSNTTGASGGVLYYELGTARPDLVLKDIIKICHPTLLPDYTPFFFKPLD